MPSSTVRHMSIRLHPHEDYAEDYVQKFKAYCDHNLVKDYILTYEANAARPHYHSYLKTEKTKYKLSESFKEFFPALKGNGYFSFKQVNDEEKWKKYICKEGDFKLYSDNYEGQDLLDYQTDWLKTAGEIALNQQKKKQKKQKEDKELPDLFLDYIKTRIPDPPVINSKLLDLDYAIIIIKGFILEQNILSFTPQFIQKYYRLLVKTVDPEKWKLYVQEFVRSSLEKNIFVI